MSLASKEGFTPAQHFFLSYARIWASLRKKEPWCGDADIFLRSLWLDSFFIGKGRGVDALNL